MPVSVLLLSPAGANLGDLHRPLMIKKLLDDNHDTDELDADLTVADVFIDYGKARTDGLDQRGALRVIQQPTSTRSVRYGSVVQDWDAITNHHSRRAARLSRRQLAHFPMANGLASASPVKNHVAAVNGSGIPFEVAESVHPLCSIEEEPTATESHQRKESSPALGERELTQETTDTNASNLRSSPLDAFPSSARLPRHHRAQLGKDGDRLVPGVHTSLLSSEWPLDITFLLPFTDFHSQSKLHYGTRKRQNPRNHPLTVVPLQVLLALKNANQRDQGLPIVRSCPNTLHPWLLIRDIQNTQNDKRSPRRLLQS